MSRRIMKPLQAWAIVHSGDQIDCWDHRVPIFWMKKVATEELKNSFSDSRIVHVEIKEIR
jgi:hypothetical protein